MCKYLTNAWLQCFALALGISVAGGQELTEKQQQADAKVLAALRAEVVGDNVSRSLNLAEALALEPNWPQANWQSGKVFAW